MESMSSRPQVASKLLFVATLCIGVLFIAGVVWAQKTTNPDGSTRETTTSTNPDGSTVTREIDKDKDGRPTHATEKDGDNETDITWQYDKLGRVTKVKVKKNRHTWIARKSYYVRGWPNPDGSASYEVYNDQDDNWAPSPLAEAAIEDALSRFGLVLWPEVVHLTAGPGPKDTPPKASDHLKQQVPEKTSLQSDSSAAQGTATAQLVGLVYDKDSRPGDQAAVSLTTDPKKYENILALGVIEMQVPVTTGASASASLEGMVVDLGDGRKQPGGLPLTIQIPLGATSIPVIIVQQGSTTKSVQSSVPIAQGAPALVTNTGKASDFTTPPVVQNLSVINGPLSGNAQQMRITVDNQPAQIVTATPRSVFFDMPTGMTAGPHTLTLQDGQHTASAPIVKLGLVMKANQLQLQRGQSTSYSATVLLGPLPDSVWQHGGTSPELVNASEITKLVPSGFQVPQPGQPGIVLFHLENDSRQTVTIKPSQNETITRVLHQQDFQGGQFIEAGVIQSKQSGGFDIKATVQTFFAPIQFSEPGSSTLAEGGAKGQPDQHPVPVIAEDTQHKPCTGTCDKPVEGKSSDPWKPETYMSCKACSTCTQQNCACNLWKRKGGTPPGGMYPDWEFEAQQGKQAEKDATYEYSCFCTQ